jgi:Ran GTPase-activating protein (RanGAP) involved in mRNA processing and transport
MCLTICPAALCSIEDNNLRAEGGMKLAEAFAEMPNLREVKCVLAPHVQTARP